MKSTDKRTQRRGSRPLSLLAIAMLVSASSPTLGQTPSPSAADPQQTAAAPAATQTQDLFTRAELEKMLAPIALYTDALLAQVLPASAYPIQIVQAQRWLDKNQNAVAKGDYSAVDAQTWDPSVKALLRFPTVIQKMSADLDWTTDLGDAVVNQPQDVADAIQALRLKAQKSGALATTKEQKVVVRQDSGRDVVVIESADPSVIYVPTYDPVAIYDPAPGVMVGGLMAFGTAVAIGSMWNDNYWNWRTGAIYPPIWPGYPAWRAPYPGWRAGMPVVRPGGDINVGSNNNINIGNNVKPWRPDPGQYRPGLGSKPGIAGNRPGTRPGGGNDINIGNRGGGNNINIGDKGGAINIGDRGGNAVNIGDRGGNAANIGNKLGNGANVGNNVRAPGGGGAANRPSVNKPDIKPPVAAKPAPRPVQAKPPKISAPSKSAMSGIPMGAGNQAFANRGAASRGQIGGGGMRGGGGGMPAARPGGMGGGGAAMRPGGGGRGGGGGAMRGGGGRGRR